MDLHNASPFTRREFISTGLTLASAALFVPSFIQRSALGLPMPAPGLSSMPGVNEDRILVVVQLSGGNDGLNTLVPYGDAAYYKARAGIGIPEPKVVKLDKGAGRGLHPALAPLADLYHEGQAAVVQGVGYPNPNRSHFKSMDIWHTADTTGTGAGWLGKYMDAECCGFGKGESGAAEAKPGAAGGAGGSPGIAIGRDAPLAMQGTSAKPVAFENTDLFRWMGQDVHKALVKPYDELTRAGVVGGAGEHSNAAFLMRTALDAQVSSDQIRKAVSQKPLVDYPNSDLARQLAMVGSMIRAGLKTRVYYVTQGGFDTHAGQGGENGRHAQLLGQYAQAVRAFQRDLVAQSNQDRVLTMTFSEFGRRVGQNASGGTDHGTAAPMFLTGSKVNAGLLGTHPSMTDLDDGDLKFTTDFRGVYAGILEEWLGARSQPILDGVYKPVKVVKG
jgi:uncharacterized protein (DUF1501 family)